MCFVYSKSRRFAYKLIIVLSNGNDWASKVFVSISKQTRTGNLYTQYCPFVIFYFEAHTFLS